MSSTRASTRARAGAGARLGRSLRHRAEALTGPAGRAAVVVGASLIVAYGLTRPAGTPVNRLGLALVAGSCALLAPPWLLVAAVALSMRSLNLAPVAGPVTVADVLIGVYIARRAWVLLSERRLRFGGPVTWLLLFLGWAWLCTVFSGVGTTPLQRLTLYGALCAVLAADRALDKRALYGFFCAFAVIEVAWSIPSQGSSRLIGLHIGDPHQLSLLAMAGLAPLVAGALRPRGWRVLVVLLVMGVLLARSRGPIVAMGAMLALPLLGALTRRKVATLMALLVVGGAALYGPATQAFDLNPASREFREVSIERGLRAGLSSPLFGKGWSANLPTDPEEAAARRAQNRAFASDVQPYNLLVSTFAFTGVPGVLLLGAFLASSMHTMIGRDRTGVLFATAFLTLSVAEMTLYAQSLGTVLFFIYVGLGLRAPTELDEDHPTVGPTTGRRALR
ncbi:MAG: O-antigen ligase family protein [Actinomycetota bacterium]